MHLDSNFSWITAKDTANLAVSKITGKYLSDLEVKVLQGSWEEKTYEEMSTIYGYSSEYLNKDIGNKLWHKLSDALTEKVNKKNFKEALKREWQQHYLWMDALVNTEHLIFPEGSVAANSPYYIEPFEVKSLGYQNLIRPGSLITIKAPKLMGKTSLINVILAQALEKKYQTVYLDLNSINRDIFDNLDKFLRWFCPVVSRELKLENQVKDYWDVEFLGSNDNCTGYFEEYLLTQINCPLVLALDNLDKIFPYPEIIEDFLSLLRSWHEKGKIFAIWQQLILAISHSTEVDIPLDLNQSIFNVGITINLGEFKQQQLKKLSEIHHLNWKEAEIEKLEKLIGGHPYLVRLAMYEISSGNLTLEQLLQQATSEAGIYSNHLRRYLQLLEKIPELAQAWKIVVNSSEPVELNSLDIYKLHSMGLVTIKNNHVVPRCNLYREYFQRVLK